MVKMNKFTRSHVIKVVFLINSQLNTTQFSIELSDTITFRALQDIFNLILISIFALKKNLLFQKQNVWLAVTTAIEIVNTEWSHFFMLFLFANRQVISSYSVKLQSFWVHCTQTSSSHMLSLFYLHGHFWALLPRLLPSGWTRKLCSNFSWKNLPVRGPLRGPFFTLRVGFCRHRRFG